MKKKLLYLIMLVVAMCSLVACTPEEEEKEGEVVEDANALIDKYVGANNEEDKEDDEDSEEDSKDEDDDNQDDVDYDEIDQELIDKIEDETQNVIDSGNNDIVDDDVTLGYEQYGRMTYDSTGYSFFIEQDGVKAYISTDYTESMAVIGQEMEGVDAASFYTIMEVTLEAQYGEMTQSGTYESSNGYSFRIYGFVDPTSGAQGEIYLAVENDYMIGVIGANINGTLSNDFKKVVDSIKIN